MEIISEQLTLLGERFILLSTDEDYDSINFFPFNRESKYRDDLAKSINEFGFQCVIDVIETDLLDKDAGVRMYVAEGQHRLRTARRLKIPIIARVCTHKFKTLAEIVKFVASRNNTQKKWNPENYVDAFMFLGFKEYQILSAVTKTCAYSVTTVAEMLHGFRSRRAIGKHIANGTFRVNLFNETHYTLQLCAKLSKYGELSARMATALHYVASLASFNEVKFINAYKKEYNCIKELKLDDYSDIFASWLA